VFDFVRMVRRCRIFIAWCTYLEQDSSGGGQCLLDLKRDVGAVMRVVCIFPREAKGVQQLAIALSPIGRVDLIPWSVCPVAHNSN
jgi:hypothetical protein